MAEEVHLDALKKGAEFWNGYKRRWDNGNNESSENRIDLTGAWLQGKNLRRYNLDNVYLYGAELAKADLRNASLVGAGLSEAILTEARLMEADLTRAILIEADLNGANLSMAHLVEAVLGEANLEKARLWSAKLAGVDLTAANLTEAHFSNADLTNANLTKADLFGSKLSGTNLSGADLSESNLTKADLSGADLTGARLSKVNLTGAKLHSTNLSEATLIDADLSGADLIWADLTKANLFRADLEKADLTAANMTDGRLEGAKFAGANLQGAILPGSVDFRSDVRLAAESLQETRPVLLTLMWMIVYSAISLFAASTPGVPETALAETATVQLFFGQKLPRPGFLILSSLLVLVVHLYALLRLQRFWRIGTGLPRRLPDGALVFEKIGGFGPAEFVWNQLNSQAKEKEKPSDRFAFLRSCQRLLSFFFRVVAWFLALRSYQRLLSASFGAVAWLLAPLFTGIMTMTALYEWRGVTGVGWPWTAMVCGMFFVISACFSCASFCSARKAIREYGKRTEPETGK